MQIMLFLGRQFQWYPDVTSRRSLTAFSRVTAA